MIPLARREPAEGLAPKVVEVVTEVIRDICRRGVAVLLVEREGTPASLRNSPEVRRDWLEVA